MSLRHTSPGARRRGSRRLSGLVAALGLALVLHVLLLGLLAAIWPSLEPDIQHMDTRPVTLVVETVEPEEPEPEPEPKLEFDGQLVDTPKPEKEERPDDSEYLAEHDNVVEEEMRDRNYRVNPEVLSEQFAEDDQLQFEEADDVNVTEPSTGAQVGNDRFDPDRDGRMAAVPSPYTLTNKDGLQKPVPASSSTHKRAGAPNNDLLREKIGEATRLNTREIVGAQYLNRIRRLVNFYWKQNLDNLPRSVILARPSYTTAVSVILNANGALEHIEVSRACGSEELDAAVVSAFRVAGPFPNPPEQLIEQDGRIYLPEMAFTVELGQARAQFQGVDPRAGVRFPGILKSPR